MADYEIAHESPEERKARLAEEERAKHAEARRRLAEVRKQMGVSGA
jgi:hypothetical protein